MELNILLVDDEKKILDITGMYLKKEGYNVLSAFNGKDAMKIFKSTCIDLVILDLMMPKMSGQEVCEKIRETSDVPIIILTARNSDDDKVNGFYIGADDYVVKPFSNRELISRVSALLRRSYKKENIPHKSVKHIDDSLEVHPGKLKAFKNGNDTCLTVVEFNILNLLISNSGYVFSREEIVDKVFGSDFEGIDRTIDTHIKNIRKKIEDDPKEPVYIITVYRAGYKFADIL